MNRLIGGIYDVRHDRRAGYVDVVEKTQLLFGCGLRTSLRVIT
jgi:hypothetical protein